MLSRIRGSETVLLSALVAGGLLIACAAQHLDGFEAEVITVHESSALAGTAFGQRKLEMQRALRDMTAFHMTMEGMIDRRNRGGVDTFSSFLTTYFQSHLNPMLQAPWQSKHAELIDLDVNLRVLEADVLIQMGRSRDVHRVLARLNDRYRERDGLLIAFPIGEQSPLGEVVELLKLRLDSCMSSQVSWGPAGRFRTRRAVLQSVCLGPG